jgi:hypothetical protein
MNHLLYPEKNFQAQLASIYMVASCVFLLGWIVALIQRIWVGWTQMRCEKAGLRLMGGTGQPNKK